MWAGGWRGYTAHLLALPERQVGACALCNRTASPASELLAFGMLDRAAGWEPLPWAERFLEQKRRFRAAGQARLAQRLSRPTEPAPAGAFEGVFEHGGYGRIRIEAGRLRFRDVDLPLAWRGGLNASADGGNADFPEICWDLTAEAADGQVVAWHFNPDAPAYPCRFARVV